MHFQTCIKCNQDNRSTSSYLKSLQISAKASFLPAFEFVVPNEFVALLVIVVVFGLPQISLVIEFVDSVPVVEEAQGSDEPKRLLFDEVVL